MPSNDTDRPIVSVVTPAYNEEKFLPEAIHSVERQTYDRIEHVIVNDGSTDQTADILHTLERQVGHNLRWVSQENQGFTSAVNQGFEMAKGEFIIWLNGDDVLFRTDAVECVVNEFQQGDSDFLYSSYARIDSETRIHGIIVPHREFSERRLKRLCFGAFIFMRRKVIENISFNEAYDHVSDYEFYLRAAASGYTFNYIDDVLFAHRRHEATKTTGKSDEMVAERRRCQREYGQELGLRHRAMRTKDLTTRQLLRIHGMVLLLQILSDDVTLAFDTPKERHITYVARQISLLIPGRGL